MNEEQTSAHVRDFHAKYQRAEEEFADLLDSLSLTAGPASALMRSHKVVVTAEMHLVQAIGLDILTRFGPDRFEELTASAVRTHMREADD